MKQKKDAPVDQVLYLGNWFDRKTFTAFVYQENDQRLAKSYAEYAELISTGLWYSTKEDALKPKDLPIIETPIQSVEVEKVVVNEVKVEKPKEEQIDLAIESKAEEPKVTNVSELAANRARKRNNGSVR